MKTIITHFAPDVDAVVSVWLIKRFLAGWADARIAFVPAGKTYQDQPVDFDPDILHVDTGMGMLDHHQTAEDTCAARRTLEFIVKAKSETLQLRSGRARKVKPFNYAQGEREKDNISKKFPDEALIRMTDVVNDIDHFREVYFPNPTSDFYDFSIVAVLDGWKLIYPEDHGKIVEMSIEMLDGIYRTFQNKVWAEREIKTKGREFSTSWGKAMAVETVNDEIMRIAQKQGNIIAIRKDPKKGFVRIKALPESGVNLESVYNIFCQKDPQATWFLHASKKMVLNGSAKNPDSRPSKLALKEIIEILKRN